MMRPVLALCATIALCVSTGFGAQSPPPLRVLFLGDSGHHRPAKLFEYLKPVMATRGIDLVYTEALASLNASNLAKYDSVLIYANLTDLPKDAENALREYVESSGRGLVPLHCASFCFHNSPWYISAVGAQFERHGTGEFETEIVAPDHVIMKGYEPFRSWDETYKHTKHNEADRTVLQVRRDGEGAEPWTWVRTQGKGRVFYTAYGHDARTWIQPGFHDLLERGIRWASNKGDVFDSQPRVAKGLKPFEYAEADLPNYVAGARWGTMGEPIKTMQKPISATESQKHIAVPGGFEAKLFATDPMIHKPIAMAFDHKGRLWVSETVDYPNEKNPQGKGRDRISIIEDRDGDGTAETSTVFAEDLSIPTSFCFARGGVIVTQAPEILFLKDTNGDDRADVREVLFRGFDTSDTHAGPSNLRYGLDGWIYGIIGYAGFSGTVNGERISFRQGFFRFLPDGSKIEFLRSTNNNSWGVGISEEGLLFGSTANGCPSVFMPIANRYFESVRGWSPSVLRMISDTYRFFPITEKVRQVDWHGGFTAGAGHALYTARVFPEAYWNRTAFVAEPTGHLVATFTLHPSGADFVSHYGWNLMASDDEWTAPIAAEVGPDGCVWVIDWYNIVVQHNPTPKGFKTGKGNAYETDLRDKTHGRIYRIVPTGAEIAKQAALDPKQPDELLNALGSQNMFWRMHAQRLLVERGDRDVVPKLLKLAADAAVEEPLGLNAKATHALWALRGLGAIEGPNAIPEARAAALAALSHQAAGVRRNAIAVAPRDEAATVAVLKSGALRDSEPQVRLAALLALADSPESAAAAEALVDRLVGEEIVLDPVLAQGYTTAAARHAESFLVAAGRAKWARVVAPETIELMTRVAEHHARGTGPMDRILVALASADRRIARAVVGGLDRGWPQNRAVALSGEARAAFDRILESTTESGDSQASLLSLSRKLGVEGIEAAIERVVTALVAELDDESKLDATRVATARRFMMFDPNAAQKILSRITPKTSPALAAGWIEAMGSSNQPEVGVALVQALPKLLPEARAAAIKLLVERAAWTRSLLDGIDSGAVRLDQLALDQRQALLANRDKALADRAQKLMARGGSLPDPDRQAVIEKLGPLLAQGGDAEKGKALFTQHCAKCHRHSGEGGNVGPDLTGMAAHPREELIIHLLDPSRSVEGTFVTYNVATLDGRLLSGLLAAESRTSIELVDAEGKRQTVLREDIDELTATKKSLMPEGFEKQVSTDELRDVLAFLTKRGKYLPLDLAKVATTISTKGMFYDETADVERLVFTDWSPKTVDGVPFVLIDPQGARVRNAVVLRSPSGLLTRGLPRSIELPCHSPAKAIHILGGVGGWAHPYGDGKTVSMIVRLHYKDGATEDHELLNGVHIADYIRVVDVPESKLAFRLRGQQIRSLTITPKREDEIERLELVKGPDDTAPVVMAVTVETR